ncbi:hypothetical protein EMCRGX_G002032 [Ephydatia muelleri]
MHKLSRGSYRLVPKPLCSPTSMNSDVINVVPSPTSALGNECRIRCAPNSTTAVHYVWDNKNTRKLFAYDQAAASKHIIQRVSHGVQLKMKLMS